jgi:sulfatase maturation enzyme AslB (radical SAM superfamily)
MKIKGYNLSPRKLKKIRNRLKKLPSGLGFLKYLFNKVNYIYLRVIKSTKVAFPTSVILEVTNHCNLECITCPREYAYGNEMDKGLMNQKGMFKIIDEVAPYVDSIGLTGLGEPLIYKKLQEALVYIKSKNKGIQTSISTNAHVPMTEEYLSKIIPHLDQVLYVFKLKWTFSKRVFS